jgi:alpha-tubulin suppressor-like RCC1 family protein
MAGFKINGVDLDSLFEPIGDTSKRADVSYKISGSDISNFYADASLGTPYGTTNYKSGNIDIGTLFAAIGSVSTVPLFLYIWGNGVSGQNATTTPLYSWSVISSHSYSNAAIRNDGGLFTWGSQTSYGRLGLNDTITRSFPTQVGSSSWTMVGVGPNHTAAIRSDGTLFTWGSALGGKLGFGDTANVNRSSPTQIGASSWTTVSAGDSSTAAIRSDGALFTWGQNGSGILGINNTISRSSPVQVGTSSWTAVTMGRLHAAAIRTDGALFTWGTADNGRTAQFDNLYSWTTVSAGGDHTAAIRNDGMLFTWGGFNSVGLLGTGDTFSRSTPTQIGNNTWTTVSAGASNTAAIRSDGILFTWGGGSYGQLGFITSNVNRSSPVQIGSDTWYAVSVGEKHIAAIRSDRLLFAMGLGSFGRLGTNDIISRSSPTQIGTSSWNSVSAGRFSSTIGEAAHTAAIRIDGALFTWGINRSGQTSHLEGINSWTSIGTSDFSLAIRSDGLLFSWGLNANGRLGLGDTVYRSSPTQVGSSSWTSIGTGVEHASAIRSDGALFTWGVGTSGRLGLATTASANTTARSSPTQVGASSWTSISAGDAHTIAIRSDGILFTWGNNSQHALGTNDSVARSSPTQIGASSWTSVSAGQHVAAIRSDGALFIWGSGTSGKLGLGGTTNRSSPVQIGSDSWTMVTASTSLGHHTAAIRSDGLLFTWGAGTSGRLGLATSAGANTFNRSSPTQVGASSWTSISAGVYSSVGLMSNGLLFSWGLGTNGRLGLGNTNARSSPTQIGSSSWTLISTSKNFNGTFSAITNNNLLYSWGYNSLTGVLGVSDSINRSAPNQIGGNNRDVQSPLQVGNSSWSVVSAGPLNTAGILSNGKLFTWGDNSSGRLGLGDTLSRSSPTQVGSDNWTTVSSGGSHTAAVRDNGLLFNWGSGTSGRLGIGLGSGNRSSPVQVGTSSWTFVSAGGFGHSIANTNNFIAYTWGIGTSGRLGLNDTFNRSLPSQLGGGLLNRSEPAQLGSSSWTVVSASATHTAAIRSDAVLFTWGLGSYGRLGLNDTFDRSSPTQVGASTWTSVSAGIEHTAAIRSDSKLFTWGANIFGRLAIGDNFSRSSPTQVGSSNWIAIAANGNRTYVLDNNNILFGAGADNIGEDLPINRSFLTQIGDNIISFSSPVQIGTLSWTNVSVKNSHVIAIRSDRMLFTWGNNSNGKLGINSSANENRSSPVQIGSSSWTAISVGYQHSLAIRSDGKLFSWGLNSYGRLGLNDTFNRSSPTQVGTDTWSKISSGGAHSLAIRNDSTLWAFGRGASGRLGDGSTFNRTVPFQISTSSWTAISAGYLTSGAIRSDNLLFMWGINSSGRLGLGVTTTFSRSSPTQVGTQSWTAISVGELHTLGISYDKLFSWGANNYGQLGHGDLIVRSSPTQIGTSSWTAISSGKSHSAAIKSDGLLFTWGGGTGSSNGILGISDTLRRSSPTQVGSNSWKLISAGYVNTSGLRE